MTPSHRGVEGHSAQPIIENYHRFLVDHQELAAESQELLEKLSVERLLTFGGKPFCRYLRPHFITPSQHRAIVDVVTTLSSAFIKLRRAILEDEALLEQLALTPQERHLALLDPGFEEPSPSARLDSFWSESNWQFVEMNAESPASIAYCDVLSQTFLDLPVFGGWLRESGYKVDLLLARERFLEQIERVWQEFRSNRAPIRTFSERPNIAIVDWAGVPTATEFELFKQYFEQHGYPTVIATPQSLEYRDGRLYAGDFVIDIYYKRVLTSELLARPDAAQATVPAYEDGAICMINSFRAKLLHKKMSLALLHDDANAHLFSEAELRTIRAHIPWTRKVVEGYTTRDGERLDLLPFIVDNRQNLVLKPNDEYGGKGVVIGWETSDAQWRETLQEAVQSSYVVQWAVQLEKEPYPYSEGGQVLFRDLTADLDPFTFGADTQGILTRLSAASLLNVTAGTGSVVPTIVVDKA